MSDRAVTVTITPPAPQSVEQLRADISRAARSAKEVAASYPSPHSRLLAALAVLAIMQSIVLIALVVTK